MSETVKRCPPTRHGEYTKSIEDILDEAEFDAREKEYLDKVKPETVKRYLLPSEIEGVLRSGGHVFSDSYHACYRIAWSCKTGISCSVMHKNETEWCESYVPTEKLIKELFSSYFCYALVPVCECGQPLPLDGKCMICDDYFG